MQHRTRYRRGSLRSQRGWAWLSWAVPAAAKVLGSVMGKDSQEDANHQNYMMQKEFAQHGIRWRVEDAKAAGLHPLAALGATGASASPAFGAFDHSALGDAGQDLSRAFLQGKTQPERDDSLAKELMQSQLETSRNRNIGEQLDNELKRLQLARLQQQVGPALPAAQSFPVAPPREFDTRELKPSEQVSGNRFLPGREAAPTPGFKTYRYGQSDIDLPGQQLSESLEGMGALGHFIAPWLVGRHWYDQWKMHRDALGPPRRGYIWRMQPDGTWKEVPR